jgi:hypothetical protein
MQTPRDLAPESQRGGRGLEVLKSFLTTVWLYGLAGWIYVAAAALLQPQSLPWQLTHLTPWIREDTFGIVCFVASAISFFCLGVIRSKSR